MLNFWKNNKERQKNILFILLLLLAILFFVFSRYKIVVLSEKIFVARVANDISSQKEGLGGRKSLCRNCAMIFEFDGSRQLSFWMKGMEFDLDIIWINKNKIVHIKKNFSHTSKETISPAAKADTVLEINAGLSDKYGFEVGDEVRIY